MRIKPINKALSILITILVLILAASCFRVKTRAGTETGAVSSGGIISDTAIISGITVDTALLQGVWAENPEENAVFRIDGDQLVYTEDQSNPRKITVAGDVVTLHESQDFSSGMTVLKLDSDSLCLRSEYNDTIRLYRRK